MWTSPFTSRRTNLQVLQPHQLASLLEHPPVSAGLPPAPARRLTVAKAISACGRQTQWSLHYLECTTISKL